VEERGKGNGKLMRKRESRKEEKGRRGKGERKEEGGCRRGKSQLIWEGVSHWESPLVCMSD